MNDDILAKAKGLIAASRAAHHRRRKVSRLPEPRIVDPATHPHRWVNFTVAAEFVEMDRRALNSYVDEGRVAYEWKGRRRRINVDELVRFKRWLKERARAS